MGLTFVGLILPSLPTVQCDSAKDNRDKPDSWPQFLSEPDEKPLQCWAFCSLCGLPSAAGAVVNLCHPVTKYKPLCFFLLHCLDFSHTQAFCGRGGKLLGGGCCLVKMAQFYQASSGWLVTWEPDPGHYRFWPSRSFPGWPDGWARIEKTGILDESKCSHLPRVSRAAEVCKHGKSTAQPAPNSGSPQVVRASWAGRQAAGWAWLPYNLQGSRMPGISKPPWHGIIPLCMGLFHPSTSGTFKKLFSQMETSVFFRKENP